MKTICNLIIIDASGSMQSRVSDVKGGLIKLFSDIKENKEFYQHTIVCDFSNDFNVLVNSVNPKDLTSSIADKYSTRASTSLFDAIKKGFNLVPKGFDGVFVSTITDGEENSSKECTSEQATKLISEARENKWGITFMGCDEAALSVAKSIGIDNIMSFTNSSEGFNNATTSRSFAYTTYLASVSTGNVKTKNLFNEDN